MQAKRIYIKSDCKIQLAFAPASLQRAQTLVGFYDYLAGVDISQNDARFADIRSLSYFCKHSLILSKITEVWLSLTVLLERIGCG